MTDSYQSITITHLRIKKTLSWVHKGKKKSTLCSYCWLFSHPGKMNNNQTLNMRLYTSVCKVDQSMRNKWLRLADAAADGTPVHGNLQALRGCISLLPEIPSEEQHQKDVLIFHHLPPSGRLPRQGAFSPLVQPCSTFLPRFLIWRELHISQCCSSSIYFTGYFLEVVEAYIPQG